MRLKARNFLGLIAALFLWSGCVPSLAPQTAAEAGQMVVTVSVMPQKYFVERIGGGHVRVNVMIPPGADPHTYEPKPEQMTSLSDSTVYFQTGITFEEVWLSKMREINPHMSVVNTAAGIALEPEVETNAQHAADPSDAHAAEEMDTHIWTSPELVKLQARHILEGLVAADAAHAADYQANYEAFLVDIEQLQQEIHAILSQAPSKKFIVYHPAWGYFAREFGLEQIPIEVGGTEPSAKEMAALINAAQEAGIKVIFVQPEFSQMAAETIAAEIGGEVLAVTPLAEDWLANMRTVTEAFAAALQ